MLRYKLRTLLILLGILPPLLALGWWVWGLLLWTDKILLVLAFGFVAFTACYWLGLAMLDRAGPPTLNRP